MIPGWLVIVMGAVAGQATAAAPPVDFSGTWTLASTTTNPKPAGGGAVGLPPSDIVIRQTRTSLSIDRTAFGQVRTQEFSFDGQANTNKSGATVLVTHSHWEGKKLVTTGKMNQVTSQGYDEWTFKEVRYLDARGLMVVETEFVGTDGKVTASTQRFTTRRPGPGAVAHHTMP